MIAHCEEAIGWPDAAVLIFIFAGLFALFATLLWKA